MIKLNDTGLIVQYIQNFLKDNYNHDIQLSDIYDRDTHRALIDYLRLPEILDCYALKDLLLELFTYREIEPPNKLIDGGGIWNFDFDLTPNEIRFYNRDISECLSGGLRFITSHINEVDEACRNNGWYVSNYTTFTYKKNSNKKQRAEFILKRESRKQLLPTKDIINMINFSTNDYLLNKCFLDDNNAYHGFIQDSNNYKIALIPAKPGDTFTITHGYKYACEMAIAYSENTLSEIRQNGCTVENIVSRMSKSVRGELPAEQYEIYTIPKESNCTYLLIQMPFKKNLLNSSKSTTIKIGDINQDGVISFNKDDENSDYMLLNRYVTAIKEGSTLPFTLSGPSLIAANLNKDVDIKGNPIVDELDLKIFENKIHEFEVMGTPIDFGETTYEYKLDLDESDYDKLLVMYGDITVGNNDNILNIPIKEYQSNPWLIHDNFLPFILGSAIHKYSDIEDILWLQNKVREFIPDYDGLRSGYYDSPDDFITNSKLVWNENNTQYRYYTNNLYTGYILDNTTDMYNGNIINADNLSKSSIKIVNGRIFHNNEWTGQYILSSGYFTKEIANRSLKEIIKQFQISCNKYYKYNSDELITFITGYVDPLTEKWLDLL